MVFNNVSEFIQYFLMMLGVAVVVLAFVSFLSQLRDIVIEKIKYHRYNKKIKNNLKKNGKIPIKYKNFCIFCKWRGREDNRCYKNYWVNGDRSRYVKDDDFCSDFETRNNEGNYE